MPRLMLPPLQLLTLKETMHKLMLLQLLLLKLKEIMLKQMQLLLQLLTPKEIMPKLMLHQYHKPKLLEIMLELLPFQPQLPMLITETEYYSQTSLAMLFQMHFHLPREIRHNLLPTVLHKLKLKEIMH